MQQRASQFLVYVWLQLAMHVQFLPGVRVVVSCLHNLLRRIVQCRILLCLLHNFSRRDVCCLYQCADSQFLLHLLFWGYYKQLCLELQRWLLPCYECLHAMWCWFLPFKGGCCGLLHCVQCRQVLHCPHCQPLERLLHLHSVHDMQRWVLLCGLFDNQGQRMQSMHE